MNNNVFLVLSKKYNNIPNNSHVRFCQFILVGTLSLVFFPYRFPLSCYFKQSILLSGNAEKSVTHTGFCVTPLLVILTYLPPF